MTGNGKARIEGHVDVELLPGSATIRWNDNQLSVEYGGEVSTVEFDDDGYINTRSADAQNIAPGHNAEVLDLAVGMYETHCQLQQIE